MEFQATAKFVRTGTRKIRLVADAVRGLDAGRALVVLAGMEKAAAEPMKKVLASAVDNAKQKGVEVGNLKIAKIEVMGGPMIKRFHAVSRGMAHSYKKRMTHIRVIVAVKEPVVEPVKEKGAK